MRFAMFVVAVTALAFAHGAQAAPPKKAPPKQPAAAPEAPAPAQPGFFPCRTEGEVCYVGIVTGKNTVMVQFSNAPQQKIMTSDRSITPL